ncbi:transketolase C-terminal domain-containing protein, partial [uncultured Duncaniella sp.]|uniref:transketolase C-terminal domain-containing protein n=1 Tax=uncultured Duncaniella sp. TaxID=2768039 RepID=UPI0025AA08FF
AFEPYFIALFEFYRTAIKDYKTVVTLEDGILDGGFGQKVATYLGESPVKVVTLGLQKEFLDRYNADEVLKANKLTPAQVAESAKA